MENVPLSSSAIQQQRPLPCPIREKIMPTKYMRRKQVLAKIAASKQKREEFDKQL